MHPEGLRQGLEPRGRVHDVAEIRDLVPLQPDLGGDHRAAMQGGAELRDLAEAAAPACGLRGQTRLEVEDAAQAGRIAQPPVQRPSHQRQIADVIVDGAAGARHRQRQGVEHLAEIGLGLPVAVAIGEVRRARHVEEQEDALLADRPVIAPDQQVGEHAGTDQVADAEHEHHEGRDAERVEEARIGHQHRVPRAVHEAEQLVQNGAGDRIPDHDQPDIEGHRGDQEQRRREGADAVAQARGQQPALVEQDRRADDRAADRRAGQGTDVEERPVEQSRERPQSRGH